MNLYLDIDGVLLKKHGGPADNVLEFLKYITENFICHWLTTHSRNGENDCMQYLFDKLPSDTFQYLEKIKPAYWDMLKTEAIDFSTGFIWLDDYIMEGERMILTIKGKLDNFIEINLESNPNQLFEVVDYSSWYIEEDRLYQEAKKIVSNYEFATVTLLQRKLNIGYAKTGKILEQLEVAGIVGPFEYGKPRKVLKK